MGCGSSTSTAVHPLRKTNNRQDETGSTPDGRGDSAVSKVTTDSGVVMENRGIVELTGAIPDKLPPLTFESITESEADRVTHEAAAPDLLQEESPVKKQPKSSEILEELLSYGIIPEEQIRERSSGAAYSIMLDEKKGITRKPPARLESLKAKKAQSLHRKEDFDEKMRLVEERHKVKQDELKTRLRTKSARVRSAAPIFHKEEDEDSSLTPVELLQLPLTTDQTPALTPQHQFLREAVGRGEWVREAGGDDKALQEEVTGTSKTGRGEEQREKRDKRREDGEEEEGEVTHVEELRAHKLFTVSGELESDFSFLHPDDRDEIF